MIERLYLFAICVVAAAATGFTLPAAADITYAPGKVSDITVYNVNGTATPMAQVSFTFPESDVAGYPIEDDTRLSARVSCNGNSVVSSGFPGSRITVVIDTEQGVNEIGIRASIGSDVGPTETVSVYTGFDVPGDVTALKAYPNPDLSGMILLWERPEKGYHSATLTSSPITYEIYLNTTGSPLPSNDPEAWEFIGDIRSVTEFRYLYGADEPQKYIEIGVRPVNNIGKSPALTVVSEVLGRSYTLPYQEDFRLTDGLPASLPWTAPVPDDEYTARWEFTDFASAIEGEEGEGILMTGESHTKGRIGFPRFSTGGTESVTVALDIYGGPEAAKAFLRGLLLGSDNVMNIADAELPESEPGFRTWTVDLPMYYTGQRWVQLYLDFVFTDQRKIGALKNVFIDGVALGVEDVEAGETVSIKTATGGISITAGTPTQYSIISADGIPAASGIATASESFIPLQRGIYIVVCGQERKKIAVG